MTPGAVAKITNCRSGSSSGSFLFTTDLRKILYKKIMVAEEVFVNCYNLKILIPLLKSKKVIFKVSYKLSGAGGERNIFGSAIL